MSPMGTRSSWVPRSSVLSTPATPSRGARSRSPTIWPGDSGSRSSSRMSWRRDCLPPEVRRVAAKTSLSDPRRPCHFRIPLPRQPSLRRRAARRGDASRSCSRGAASTARALRWCCTRRLPMGCARSRPDAMRNCWSWVRGGGGRSPLRCWAAHPTRLPPMRPVPSSWSVRPSEPQGGRTPARPHGEDDSDAPASREARKAPPARVEPLVGPARLRVGGNGATRAAEPPGFAGEPRLRAPKHDAKRCCPQRPPT
jgi:hypothetical protein